jgi:cytochrome c-type biogenesis protein
VDGTTQLWFSFLAGIYAPVGSPCIIVLYPGYLSFLAGTRGEHPTISPFSLGLAVAAGVMVSLFLGGIFFALLEQVLGSAIRSVITPVAFLLLVVFSLLLLSDFDPIPPMGRFPLSYPRSPHGSAFLVGLLFGIFILPCNAAVIMILLALATTASGAVEFVAVFLTFGMGITLPLLLLAAISRIRSRQVLQFLTRHRLLVRRIAGMIMLFIAVWYLVLFFFPGVFR